MNSPISLLLALQDKDVKLSAIKAKLASATLEIKSISKEIESSEKRFDEHKAEFRALEAKAANMRAERKQLEAKISKYRKQMLETKKNDDYLALNDEINRMSAMVSDMESAELQTMMDLDVGRETLEEHKAECEHDIAMLNGRIWEIKEHLARLESECEDAQEQVAEAESKLPEIFLHAYRKIRNSGKKFPIVVRYDGEKCCGCFLKVSAEVASKFSDPDQPVLCEQCGRIMYAPHSES